MVSNKNKNLFLVRKFSIISFSLIFSIKTISWHPIPRSPLIGSFLPDGSSQNNFPKIKKIRKIIISPKKFEIFENLIWNRPMAGFRPFSVIIWNFREFWNFSQNLCVGVIFDDQKLLWILKKKIENFK